MVSQSQCCNDSQVRVKRRVRTRIAMSCDSRTPRNDPLSKISLVGESFLSLTKCSLHRAKATNTGRWLQTVKKAETVKNQRKHNHAFTFIIQFRKNRVYVIYKMKKLLLRKDFFLTAKTLSYRTHVRRQTKFSCISASLAACQRVKKYFFDALKPPTQVGGFAFTSYCTARGHSGLEHGGSARAGYRGFLPPAGLPPSDESVHRP